jgi:hypothetical protein
MFLSSNGDPTGMSFMSLYHSQFLP